MTHPGQHPKLHQQQNTKLKKEETETKAHGFKLHGLNLNRCPTSSFHQSRESRRVMEPQPQPTSAANLQSCSILQRDYLVGL